MPASTTTLAVVGTTRNHASGVLFVLSDRLDGYDTFLTGRLEISGRSIPVQILTLDDMTVLRPASDQDVSQFSGQWEGRLYLPHGLRSRNIPTDLTAEAARHRRDLTALSAADLRYALTFLGEATTEHIRMGRIDAIVSTLPSLAEERDAKNALISLDLGGTLGSGNSPSLATLLIAESPLDPARARRILRSQLHTLPELSPAAIADICQELQIRPSDFPKDLPPSTFRPFPAAIDCIRRLSYYGKMVTISNVTCLEVDTESTYQLFSPWITEHFPSCRTGYAKPDRRAFQFAAEQLHTDIRQMIHIGDDWECDVLGALGAGARAIYISQDSSATPEVADEALDGVLVANDLDHAVSLVGNLVRSQA